MKVICSEGGPLIGIDKRSMHSWSGAFGKTFFENSHFQTDYEAICNMIDGCSNPIRNITKFVSSAGESLIITIPVETAVVKAGAGSIFLAQVEAAEEGWSFSDIEDETFNQASFNKDEEFTLSVSEKCQFVLFDAAYSADQVGEDCLIFDVERGLYRVSSGFSNQELVELNLFKIEITR